MHASKNRHLINEGVQGICKVREEEKEMVDYGERKKKFDSAPRPPVVQKRLSLFFWLRLPYKNCFLCNFSLSNK